LELADLVKRAEDAGVTRILVPGTQRQDAPLAVEIAEKFERVYAGVGFHPHEAADFREDEDLRLFEELCQSKKVVAVGEIGLDYFYDHSPRDVQLRVLKTQLEFAKSKDLPVLLHNRESEADLLQALRDVYGVEGGKGVFHSFCAGIETAEEAIGLGFFLSFSGMVTFRSAENVRVVARQVPLASVLVETDAPYLAPVPHRGKPNEPAYVKHVAEKLAEIRGETFDVVAKETTANFCRLFGVS
jgi:TatD DNase family protein